MISKITTADAGRPDSEMGLFAMQTYDFHGSRDSQGSRRRRSQSATVRLKDTPELRLLKLAVLVFLTVITVVIIGAKFLPEERQAQTMTAEQERACTRAYLSAYAKAMEALCNPGNRRQPDAAASSQASLP